MKVMLVSPEKIRSGLPTRAACSFEALRRSFAESRGVHELTESPDEAELIIASVLNGGFGPCLEALRTSSIFRRHGEKVVAYSIDDNQFPGVRGLYPSVRRRWVEAGWAAPAHYISSHFQDRELSCRFSGKDLAFSFQGSAWTHPVRRRIMSLPAGGGAVLTDAARAGGAKYWWRAENRNELAESYADVLRRSRFVIAPRGVSPSSIRLFEAMRAGAVPIIVADDLVLPWGPDWPACSVRVSERDVSRIPDIVRRFEPDAARMGAAARKAWEQYFSPEATAGSVVTWAARLIERPARRPWRLRLRERTHPGILRRKLRFHRTLAGQGEIGSVGAGGRRASGVQ